MKAQRKHLIGRTIVDVAFRPFQGENGMCHDPRIELDNGRAIFFVTEETGGPEYGTSVCITNATKAKRKPTAAVLEHPQQPIVKDSAGVDRFKENKIVSYLLDRGGISMNDLAVMPFSKEDRRQFAQLIGYSVNGYHELSYTGDDDTE